MDRYFCVCGAVTWFKRIVAEEKCHNPTLSSPLACYQVAESSYYVYKARGLNSELAVEPSLSLVEPFFDEPIYHIIGEISHNKKVSDSGLEFSRGLCA